MSTNTHILSCPHTHFSLQVIIVYVMSDQHQVKNYFIPFERCVDIFVKIHSLITCILICTCIPGSHKTSGTKEKTKLIDTDPDPLLAFYSPGRFVSELSEVSCWDKGTRKSSHLQLLYNFIIMTTITPQGPV